MIVRVRVTLPGPSPARSRRGRCCRSRTRSCRCGSCCRYSARRPGPRVAPAAALADGADQGQRPAGLVVTEAVRPAGAVPGPCAEAPAAALARRSGSARSRAHCRCGSGFRARAQQHRSPRPPRLPTEQFRACALQVAAAAALAGAWRFRARAPQDRSSRKPDHQQRAPYCRSPTCRLAPGKNGRGAQHAPARPPGAIPGRVLVVLGRVLRTYPARAGSPGSSSTPCPPAARSSGASSRVLRTYSCAGAIPGLVLDGVFGGRSRTSPAGTIPGRILDDIGGMFGGRSRTPPPRGRDPRPRPQRRARRREPDASPRERDPRARPRLQARRREPPLLEGLKVGTRPTRDLDTVRNVSSSMQDHQSARFNPCIVNCPEEIAQGASCADQLVAHG